jgi:hypothetical protein
MSYYFKCETCNKKETFAENTNDNKQIAKGKKQDYETVICKTCIAKKVNLKGNYIII